MLGNIDEDYVVSTFKEMNIGEIFYIDMHRKINENKNPYYFAFISLRLFNTKNAKNFSGIMNKDGYTQFTYDLSKNHYWEIKKHIPRALRPAKKESLQLYPSSFTQEDHQDILMDFCLLEKEIHQLCCAV